MTAQLGLGYDGRVRRSEELIGLYFAKLRQHVLTAKSNDNGEDIRRELRSFTADSPPPPGLTMTLATAAPTSPASLALATMTTTRTPSPPTTSTS